MSKYDHYTICLNNIFPPIPLRQFDWEATLEGYDKGDPVGYGATKIEAVKDLLEQLEACE